MKKITYSSNNSGGTWWLSDQNWIDLEKAGWVVDWFKNQEDRIWKTTEDGRWLGALASQAFKEFEKEEDAIKEWESITGCNSQEEGCSCCGQPHSFYDF